MQEWNKADKQMESSAALTNTINNENQSEIKGNGNLKRKHGIHGSSDDENDFLGFDQAEQTDSQHMIQNIKKICTDSSSDETTPKRLQTAHNRSTDITDPVFKLPFKYGWKRELVLRAEPTRSKEKGEVYYITPTGKKLRTRQEIENNLHDDLTIDNFTLVKVAIGAGDDEIIRPAKFYNYSRRSNVDPVVAEATAMPIGKRVPKPKLPKGASPPPLSSYPSTPTTALTSPTFTGNPIKSISMKENIQASSKSPVPVRKPAVKGKLKGDVRCTIQCPSALGKIPQLQCIVCLCLYHPECAKKSIADIESGTSFTCENCNFKFTKAAQNAPAMTKKHHQSQPTTTEASHNFEKNPQTLVTLNGKKFIVYETDSSNGIGKKVPNRSIIQKPSVVNTNRSQSVSSSVASFSPFNFSEHFLRNVSLGFDVLLHTFQYLKVQELQRASRVCRMWNLAAQSSILWRTVRMKNSHVNDWEGFARTLQRNGTVHLDLRKILMGNQEEAWRSFSNFISRVDQLQGIDLCRCDSIVVENLFVSNHNLRCINALSIKDEALNMEGLRNRQTMLEEMRIRAHGNGLILNNFDFKPLINVRHLTLTTIENLPSLLNDNAQLRELIALESLELGFCDQLNDVQFAGNLSFLQKLQRLRIEKGSQNFNVNKVLDVIAKNLPGLVQLELINCDIKNDFVSSIKQCRNIKRLLLIPTYVSQSAATNFMVMDGVMHLTSLEIIHWIVTNELLRVTELYQSENRPEKGKKSPEKSGSGTSSPVKAKDCIPVLKPVPGKEDTDDGDANIQQVEIVALKTVEAILQKRLPKTTVKLLKISNHFTWRQVIDSV
ncbi:CLUMA_CG018199, isoform A [Clunio marinus]|uniref:CLUMA_CG018199, isoform A n=1 Tax=Clunio marinus TaxID=568069 RepID=A0A1J1J053_9DIPT|nr:CLUMA_CG018199, isoform A [Clunio marinus]